MINASVMHNALQTFFFKRTSVGNRKKKPTSDHELKIFRFNRAIKNIIGYFTNDFKLFLKTLLKFFSYLCRDHKFKLAFWGVYFLLFGLVQRSRVSFSISSNS